MTLVPLRERYPNHPFTREAMEKRGQLIRQEIRPRVEQAVRSGVGSATASVVAEKVFAHVAQRGTLPAVAAAVAGASLARGTVEGAVEVGFNVYHDRPWHTNVARTTLDGMRKGAISGGLYLSIKPIKNWVGRQNPGMTAMKIEATTSGIRGGVGGFLGRATNPKTWSDGKLKGSGEVVAATALGAMRGYVAGSISAHSSGWWNGKLDRWIDVATADGVLDWQDILLDFLKGSN